MKRSNHKRLQRRKRRIERRLAPRNWKQQADPMLRGGARIEVSDRIRATEYGGLAAVHQMVQRLELDQALNRNLRIFKRHLPYRESDHVLTQAYNAMTGGRCIEDIDRLREDESLLDLLGAQRIPDPTTAGDFLRRFGLDEIVSTMDVINETRRTVWDHLPRSARREAVLEADGTFISTTGEKKRGMEINYKGEWGYHPLLISLANTQEPLYLVNRPGNVASHEGAVEWFDRAIELCRDRFDSVLLRGDTDFSLTRHFDRWSESGVKFLFGYDASQPLVARAEALSSSDWKPLERPKREARTGPRQRRENTKEGVVVDRGFKNVHLVGESVAEIPYRPSKCGQTYRLIIVQKDLTVDQGQEVLFEDVRYFFYITNDEERSAAELVLSPRGANGRCNQENLIEQMKNGVRALHAPSHDLESNWAYMVLASLAWSLKAWFGLLQRSDRDRWAIVRMEFRTFLHAVVRVVCQVLRTGRRTWVRLYKYTKYARLLLVDLCRPARAGP